MLIMLSGYSVKVGLDNEMIGETAEHFVAHQPKQVNHLDQAAPYCQRFPVGPSMETLPHTEYSGFGETPTAALEVALKTCRQDWPGIEIVHEKLLSRRRITVPC